MDSRMSDRDDQLIAAHAAHAQRQALQHIADEAENVRQTYVRQIARGDSDGAAWTLRQYANLATEANVITGPTQQQYQQSQQQAQPQGQQQFTPAEMEWLRSHENVVRDPKKWNECLAAANSLVARGYDRNSVEYLNAIELAIGLTGPDGREGVEIASPDTALEAVNNSQIARKFGPVTPDDYRQGMARLIENKKLGLYEPQQ
jgi:hypothetical protein